MDKFLHMTIFFSTGTARGARDKYEVCAVIVVNTIHSNGGGAVSITIEVGPAMDWGWLDLGRHFHLCLLLLDLCHPLLKGKYHPYDKLSAIMT